MHVFSLSFAAFAPPQHAPETAAAVLVLEALYCLQNMCPCSICLLCDLMMTGYLLARYRLHAHRQVTI